VPVTAVFATPAPGDAAPRTTVRHLVGRRIVAYHPTFAAIGGGIKAGLFLAQLFYWHDRGSDPDGWIYKTQAEWEEETGLSRWEQERPQRARPGRGQGAAFTRRVLRRAARRCRRRSAPGRLSRAAGRADTHGWGKWTIGLAARWVTCAVST